MVLPQVRTAWLLGHGVELRALRRLASFDLLEELFLRRRRARKALLLVPVEVPLARGRPLRKVALLREEREERRAGHRVPVAVGGDRLHIALEVVEGELRGLADDLGRAGRIEDPREVDGDLVVALLADLRLGDTDLVDAIPDDLHGPVEVIRRQLLPGLGTRLEHDLQPALQVEAEGRRAEKAERDDRRHGTEEDEQDEEIAAHVLGRTA